MKAVKTKKVVKRAPKGKATSTEGGVIMVKAPPLKEPVVVERASFGVRAITAVDPQALLAQAIDKGMPVESMERLLAMRREMKAEWARDQFFAALTGFQRECPVVEKAKKVMNKDKGGDKKATVRYSYAPLEDIVSTVQPFLEKWGFSWTVKPAQTDGHVKASCYAHHKDGHEELTEFEVPLDPQSYMSDPQRAAAALTFARRYAFINAFGIVTKGEDNDAQQDDEPRQTRREPIRQPQEKRDPFGGSPLPKEDAIPVQHTEGPAVNELTNFEKILKFVKATEVDPTNPKARIYLFTENEQIDYEHEANENKGKPEELAKILADVIVSGSKRRKAIKGEK